MKFTVLLRFFNQFFSSRLEFRVRLFNVLAMAGTLVAFTMGAVNCFAGKSALVYGLNWLAALGAFCLLVYSVRTQKYVRCYYITIYTIFIGLFSYLYFFTGGYKGGAPIFFLFSVVFTAFMLEGKPALFTIGIELLVYSGVFIISFLCPGLVQHYPKENQYFISNYLDFMVAAIALAAISLAHFRLYNAQQKKLDEQNVVLAQANRAKTEFLANASHEMRTPLTVTSVNVQVVMKMLENMGENLNDPEARGLLENAQGEIMRLSRMVSGMLTLASMSENTDRQKLDYSALLRSGIEMMRLTLAERGNALETDIENGLAVFGSADLLAQVLTNILQNARTYTENGTVTVSAKKQANKISVAIRDTGSGISPEFLSHVFERGASTGGTGFGLYLCKIVVESHGGRIWMESSREHGTTVFWNLPVYEGQF